MRECFVVDNSVVMSWCFNDEVDEYAEAVLESLVSMNALVPSIWPLEVVNVLVTAERRGRLRPADSIRFVSLLGNLPIQVESDRLEGIGMSRLLSLAREQGLSSYDASYLDLAMREGLPISTLDKNLRTAAIRCDVSIYSPGDF